MLTKQIHVSLLLTSLMSALLSFSSTAGAQSVAAIDTRATQGASAMVDEIKYLRSTWARIKYQTPGKDKQISAFEALEERGDRLIAAYPGRAEPKIWQGIILSTHAGVAGGLSALSLVKNAKNLFEQAIEIDGNALAGSAHTSLGSLYYQVPGWPLGFGSDKKAEAHLKRALSINPDGIDANYFYGDFLYEAGRYDDAARYFNAALQAPDRPDRPLADAGRRQEIRAALAKVQNKVKN